MPRKEPTLAEIEPTIRQMLLEEELATLATISADGWPSASTMHIAADGLSVYMQCFTRKARKFRQMREDPRVSYAVSVIPSGGYYERFKTRSLQVKGRARLVTSADEIAHAAELSKQQFDWAKDSSQFDKLKTPDQDAQQAFFRIDPVEGLWGDNSVGLMWRVLLDFAPDGSRIEAMRPVIEKRTTP
ncbi:pyridoxamine 5'-phosphate oxidase family protein [Nonomuraea lactucae]|uniref:pyridoxamine 5'-phosphate oxidase family protein n=1 Tax=Nonomuraea lactucae TaxID=2249762 RepID=UPI000DE33B17|nr:pyridoxamine 5'-phosphate oxidase family protein [Nonomuraea lactucae]